MSKTEALVVVDMQPRFSDASKPYVVRNVLSAIADAKRRSAYVVVVEYSPDSYLGAVWRPSLFRQMTVTLPAIVNAVRGYRRALWTTKHRNDGSDDIYDRFDKMGVSPTRFDVCGVNLSACVKGTAFGLANWYPGAVVNVIGKATNHKDDSWPKIVNRDVNYIAA